MGIFDKVKDAAGEHRDQIDAGIQQGVDRAGDMIDEKTGGKFADQVHQGQDVAKEQAGQHLDGLLGRDQVDGDVEAEAPAEPEAPAEG